jgi:2-isopropylmalate synthase
MTHAETMNDTPGLFDWNQPASADPPVLPSVEIHDETLRDGVQSPSVHDPSIEAKREIVRLLDRLGVDSVCLGFPGASPRAYRHSEALLQIIEDEKLRIQPVMAGRTHPDDIEAIKRICDKIGRASEALLFVGSSPIRMAVERWSENHLARVVSESIESATEAGLDVGFVTEDTVRSRPETLKALFTAAVHSGARRITLCDTVGCVTASGTRRIIHWTHQLLTRMGVRQQVRIGWHGHNDRGLALSNGLVAAFAGADRVHGTVLGIGERVGNTPLDLLLVNMRLQGSTSRAVGELAALVTTTAEAMKVDVPFDYPVFGSDAFRTATGVHAAAIVKATQEHHADWANRIYSGVPAHWFGRKQVIEIGPMSGRSNVRHWLRRHGLDPREDIVEYILNEAKQANAVLTDHEVRQLLDKSV